jgi:hypothetical protein
MFPNGYFAKTYWTGTFFPPADGGVIVPPPFVFQAIRGGLKNLGRLMGT